MNGLSWTNRSLSHCQAWWSIIDREGTSEKRYKRLSARGCQDPGVSHDELINVTVGFI